MDAAEGLDLGPGVVRECGKRGFVESELGCQLFQGLPAAKLSQDRGAHQFCLQHHGHRGPVHDAPVQLEPAGVLGEPGRGLAVRAPPHAQVLDQLEEHLAFPGDFRADPGKFGGHRGVGEGLGHALDPGDAGGGAGQVVREVQTEELLID